MSNPNERPSQLHAPTKRLEKLRVRGNYLPDRHAVPSDSGYLNYVTERVRSRLGRELGIEAAVEGAQVINR